MTNAEFFGSQQQRSMMQKADSLWRLVEADKRFQSHGRAVAVNYNECDDLEIPIALARLQGAGVVNNVPVKHSEALTKALEERGFKTDRFEIWAGGTGALKASRAVVQQNKLPDDLDQVYVDESTEPEKLNALAELTQSCGVLLPMGSFMRGIARPSVCLFAQDKTGLPVGSSASVAVCLPDSKDGEMAWWGMLATHIDRRGEGIALHLGARSMIAMNERHGFELFSTGIRAGNSPSEKLCTKLGLSQTDYCVIIVMDPASFKGEKLTK